MGDEFSSSSSHSSFDNDNLPTPEELFNSEHGPLDSQMSEQMQQRQREESRRRREEETKEETSPARRNNGVVDASSSPSGGSASTMTSSSSPSGGSTSTTTSTSTGTPNGVHIMSPPTLYVLGGMPSPDRGTPTPKFTFDQILEAAKALAAKNGLQFQENGFPPEFSSMEKLNHIKEYFKMEEGIYYKLVPMDVYKDMPRDEAGARLLIHMSNQGNTTGEPPKKHNLCLLSLLSFDNEPYPHFGPFVPSSDDPNVNMADEETPPLSMRWARKVTLFMIYDVIKACPTGEMMQCKIINNNKKGGRMKVSAEPTILNVICLVITYMACGPNAAKGESKASIKECIEKDERLKSKEQKACMLNLFAKPILRDAIAALPFNHDEATMDKMLNRSLQGKAGAIKKRAKQFGFYSKKVLHARITGQNLDGTACSSNIVPLDSKHVDDGKGIEIVHWRILEQFDDNLNRVDWSKKDVFYKNAPAALTATKRNLLPEQESKLGTHYDVPQGIRVRCRGDDVGADNGNEETGKKGGDSDDEDDCAF